MSEKKYSVTFKGDIAEDASLDEVKEKLAAVYKKDISKIDLFFTGKLTIIKKEADLQTCEKIKNVFGKAGAICFIKEHKIGKEHNTGKEHKTGDADPKSAETGKSSTTLSGAEKSETKNKKPTPKSPSKQKLTRKADEKFCESCGNIIKQTTEVCPYCKTRIEGRVRKLTLLLITLFTGGIGGHKFYLGNNFHGALYLLFSLTGIPSLIAMIEFIIYVFTSEDDLQEKIPPGKKKGSTGLIITLIIIYFIVISVIFAAITLPHFIMRQEKTYVVLVKAELKRLNHGQEIYFNNNNRYADNIEDLEFGVSIPGVSIRIVKADKNCYEAIGSHEKLKEYITIDCRGFGTKNSTNPEIKLW
ncbi:MAG: TM2 domain-containing protein [Desulfobacterales bacterium]|jgi:hypothetical protein|nr:TM2 domain-containing protein [Desulfobacteraceae bacterium]MBT4364881.1 TM2 domain-containing protein [Desulfobacteraceae bacterium]MBT7086629.1 TM2 domain-containing protein [Desulfobacterales bacterium]MBT7698570.1 TM2 domain-containing protein [Desulfobacterales bacterium]